MKIDNKKHTQGTNSLLLNLWFGIDLQRLMTPGVGTITIAILHGSFAVIVHKTGGDWTLLALYQKAVTITSGPVVTGIIFFLSYFFRRCLYVNHPSVSLNIIKMVW